MSKVIECDICGSTCAYIWFRDNYMTRFRKEESSDVRDICLVCMGDFTEFVQSKKKD